MRTSKDFVQDYLDTEDASEERVTKDGPAETVHDLINLFCTTHDEWRPADTMQVYRGFTPDIDALCKALPPSFLQKEEWSDYPHRVIWVSEEEFSTCTYRNGYITITLHPRKVSFLLELQYAEEHYRQV